VYKRQALRALVSFARLNLMQPFPMRGPFDAIWCRNVMIYFDRDTQQDLGRRMAALLRPGGVLYIGHSETFNGMVVPLRAIGPAMYQRP
jgi:chemotaxis protein methyltransferase CheR